MDVSLIISCQLLWREFFYMSGVGTPNFDRMEVYIPINILIIVGIEWKPPWHCYRVILAAGRFLGNETERRSRPGRRPGRDILLSMPLWRSWEWKVGGDCHPLQLLPLHLIVGFYFVLIGWIHHLARHAVACFLTRGDLWQHWEEVGGEHYWHYCPLLEAII